MLPKFHLNINILSVLKNPQQSHLVIYSESIRELEKSPEPYYFDCLIIYSIFLPITEKLDQNLQGIHILVL